MITLLAVSGQLHSILVGALLIAILILLVAGLLWCIERWISPVPAVAKLILALLILLGVVLWAFNLMGINI
jgi:hypothetical protein